MVSVSGNLPSVPVMTLSHTPHYSLQRSLWPCRGAMERELPNMGDRRSAGGAGSIDRRLCAVPPGFPGRRAGVWGFSAMASGSTVRLRPTVTVRDSRSPAQSLREE